MKNTIRVSSLVLLQFAMLAFAAIGGTAENARGGHGEYYLYVGTAIYTAQGGQSIYGFRFKSAAGELTPLGVMGETANPGFVGVHPNHKFLYAVSETGDVGAKEGGWVNAFSIDQHTGKLTFLNKVPSGGSHPTALAIDHTGKYVAVANYFGGTVLVFPIQKDGRLGQSTARVEETGSGVDPKRQEAPHPHSVGFSADNRFVLSADLGLDKVLICRFDPAKGSLVMNDPPYATAKPGAGARHFAFSPNSKFLYVINEMGSSLCVFSYDAARGSARLLQTISTLPGGFKGEKAAAEVQVHPSGKYLYASNRGTDNSIAVFAIDRGKGTLTLIERVPSEGKTPRNFVLDPTGSWLLVANQDSNNVVVFRIDQKTGRLTPTGHSGQATAPTCLEFMAIP